ncbi:DNA-binding transcriptional regulator, AcrR family [Saccharopolyspora antimicrobica]|uniref:DNA-binding transcriptional regulator, AcrR family n=2 Tax=Saccharopolyspora antimicrobica TaxID=455193 RepID=A0A1I5KK53_9PSEU|nr:TetR family transcriptional regulator [Saccharopolyspora antimicrobica]SFO85267.1 DNA-binding transcriptional regulator, AcrR family [Saccharopolyspora antimicrobica]
MPAERWRELAATAASEFADAGYERASLNRVIRSCGMSKSSFYHYFDSKQQLFEAVVAHVAATVAADLEVPEPTDFRSHFWGLAERFLRRLVIAAERDRLFVDFGRICYLPDVPSGQGGVSGATAAIDDWLRRTLAVGRSAGAVRCDIPPGLQAHTAIAILRAFDEWTLQNRSDLDPGELPRLVQAQFEAMKRLLEPVQQTSA